MRSTVTLLVVSTLFSISSGCATLLGLDSNEDVGQDAGSNPDALPVDEDRLIFVTDNNYAGRELGGLQGADAICQDEAEQVGLLGTWRAWLADGVDSPATRFVRGRNDYENRVGDVIAEDYDDLVDGALAIPINLSARRVTVSVTVWSNVAIDGTSASALPDAHCNGWTLEGNRGATARTDAADAGWTDPGFDLSCDLALRLYCVEQ